VALGGDQCRAVGRSQQDYEVPVRRELDRRHRAELRQSLRNPHLESASLAEQGLEEWLRGLPEEDAETLLDSRAGTAVRWVPGEGWLEDGA
jgi:hypothetical protein